MLQLFILNATKSDELHGMRPDQIKTDVVALACLRPLGGWLSSIKTRPAAFIWTFLYYTPF
jgi:hypothetical protein